MCVSRLVAAAGILVILSAVGAQSSGPTPEVIEFGIAGGAGTGRFGGPAVGAFVHVGRHAGTVEFGGDFVCWCGVNTTPWGVPSFPIPAGCGVSRVGR